MSNGIQNRGTDLANITPGADGVGLVVGEVLKNEIMWQTQQTQAIVWASEKTGGFDICILLRSCATSGTQRGRRSCTSDSIAKRAFSERQT